ncbi:MAG: argininosuccinate synthase [Acidobacteria bacterium]|nr:argininosuccinate synthase [Acidobacteriota bacterium]
MRKVVLAYSGGLDTSIIIPWLKERYGCQVIAMAGDVGQGAELEGLREKALKTGASKVYIEDLRREFVTDFIFPTLKAGAVYEHKYLLGTSFARPLLARRQVEIARKEKADAVAHGCTGKGNDQVRFELAYKSLAPELRVIAPWREWDILSREDALAYARKHRVPVTASRKSLFSRDRNLWHISHEGGPLEDPNWEPEESLFVLTRSPEKAPGRPAYIEIGFEKGIPTSLNGKRREPVALVQELNRLGGTHGIGRADVVENRLVGMKSRGVYETPGGTLLMAAHRELEALCLDRDTTHYKALVAARYAELVYYGQWYTPLREALDAFVNVTQQNVTGTVRLKLYKGNAIVAARNSPYSLFRADLASFTMGAYNPKDAEGFINLFGLPQQIQGLLKKS